MICRRLSTIAALLLVVASAPPASAAFITYDLTGTWTGTLKCNELTGGVKEKAVSNPTMRISQVGLNFRVEFSFPGGNTQTYAGLANPNAKKPEQKGDAILIRCGTNNVLGNVGHTNTMARMSVSTKPNKVKASFKGFSIFSDPSDPEPHHGTCKWKFTRTDTIDPQLATSCPLPLQTGGAL